MNREDAQSAVAISALVVGGIYTYRRMVESSIPQATQSRQVAGLAGFGPTPPLGRFITGWGVTFTVLSILAQAVPNLGGALAVLVGVGDALGNGTALAADVNSRLTGNTRGTDTVGGNLPANLGTGQPIQQKGETNQHFDARLTQYLLAHTNTRTAPAPRTPTLTDNPFTGTPNRLIG